LEGIGETEGSAVRIADLRRLSAGVLGLAVIGGGGAEAGPVQVVDVLGNIPLAQFNARIANNSYKDWGNEPYVAVNPTNPNDIVVSSFAFSSPGASLWYSTNAGASWSLQFPIPNAPGGVEVPHDQVYAYDGAGVLHGAVLGGDGNIYVGSSTNPAANWTWLPANVNQSGAGTADQPWLAVGPGGKLYVAYDNFNSGATQSEERVAISTNNGASFPTDATLSRGGQLPIFATNPGTRLAVDGNGTAYSIIGIPDSRSGGVVHVNYALNRNSGTASSDFTNSSPNPGGLRIDSGSSTQGNNAAASFGGVNLLLGNITAIAVDRQGSHVYTVYGKQDATGTDRLYIAEFHPDPNNPGNLVERANPVAFSIPGQRAALPSIAVTDNGTVFVQYDTFTPADGLFHVHLAASSDLGLSFVDQDLYDFTAPFSPPLSTIGLTADSGSSGPISLADDDSEGSAGRILGDYQGLIALGNTVYGTFAGRGDTNAGGINTTGLIDPFFYSVAVPEPPAFVLVMTGGLASLGLWAARYRWVRRGAPDPRKGV
jgi:hypothetical protein